MAEAAGGGWTRRAHGRLRHSLKARLIALFLLLALAITGAFVAGMQNALSLGWRGAVRPLVVDYVDRLVAEIGTPPDIGRAQAIADRLPVTVEIAGPTVRWRSHPADTGGWRAPAQGAWSQRDEALLSRTTADGHRITLGLNVRSWHERPRRVGWITLAVVLLLTAGAYKAVRKLLQPLDDIRAGAQRFGEGRFAQQIPVRRRDELGDLAQEINAMAASIHQMLEAKRALLLSISHELRSPLTRARLHVELLPEEGEAGGRRRALLQDLEEMSTLVGDLLESERLGQGHAALHREAVDLAELVEECAPGADLALDASLEPLPLDRARMRLLLRNLVGNAWRHGSADRPPVVRLAREGGDVVLAVRDFGPGVDEAGLARLAEPFYRTDAARQRTTGGVGLGLYLCRLVAQAHGGRLELRNAHPGLEAKVVLPA
ncbi:MAG TPA: HAMP domain-containing sensor histidine kinase [Ramlibacter sp.]|nr:HAMP domain-containing sensor histidine kinase [Ramlibacter sp.]